MRDQRKMMSEINFLKYLDNEEEKILRDYSKVVNIRNFYMKAIKKTPSISLNLLNSFVSYSSSSSSGSESFLVGNYDRGNEDMIDR